MGTDGNVYGFDTLSLHAGQQPDPATGARAVPIYQTTSYVFRDVDHAASLFNLERTGHIYSRISNPTVAVLEERVAALEGGVGAIATASGHAGLFLAISTLMGQGGHIVASSALYGGSHNLFSHTLPRFGIETTKVNPRDHDGFRRAIRPETRLLFGETIGNPGLEVMDIAAMAAIAHEAGIPLLVDSTFATPHLCRPIDHGADLVLHSATKWLGGHGVAIGGVLVDGGTFDWEASGKFPTLTEPYAGYHGLDFAEEFGPPAFLMRARAEGLRAFGACMSPANAFHILKGAGSMVAFGIKGGREAGRTFIDRLQLWSHLANVGDAKSLVIHPASTTHQQMDAATMQAAGLSEDLVRLSVGLEDPKDLVEDLKQALRAAARAAKAA